MVVPRTFIALPLSFLALLAFSLYVGREHLARLPRPSFLNGYVGGSGGANHAQPAPPVDLNITRILSAENVTTYVEGIMNPNSTDLPRLACPPPKTARYEYLKPPPKRVLGLNLGSNQIQYFFALDLANVVDLLPQLIGSVVATIEFLGPENCALSIVEGNSPDGTGEVLAALRPKLDALTTTYYFKTSDINPKKSMDRVAALADLRNMALQPMLDDQRKFSVDTTVIFLNDVAICVEDILELIHQRRFLDADMTCAFDWTWVFDYPTFYDVWISRAMNGDSFFRIGDDGSWDAAKDLFWNEPETLSRFTDGRPFQVFACWNGGVAFTARPIIERLVTFRSPQNGECIQGEPQLFCKDFWHHGFGKIATIPSINLEYTIEKGEHIKEIKGFTSQWLREDGAAEEEDRIQWQLEPPEQVRCIQSWGDQFFRPWNESYPSD